MNENELRLTPAEVEQVEAALAAEPRVIPELKALFEAHQNTPTEAMNDFGDRVYAVIVKDSSGVFQWDHTEVTEDLDEAIEWRDEYGMLDPSSVLVVSALVKHWMVEDV